MSGKHIVQATTKSRAFICQRFLAVRLAFVYMILTVMKPAVQADFGGASGYIFPSDVQAAILK